MAERKEIGSIEHYYDRIGVAVINLRADIRVGDTVSIEGKETNFSQSITSMQIEHKEVKSAKAGESIGMKVDQKVREGDKVYKVPAE
ncbi:MAG: U32 family peptidase C-terminal domain-containing protein [Candidatus Micrarchaeales archaeon]